MSLNSMYSLNVAQTGPWGLGTGLGAGLGRLGNTVDDGRMIVAVLGRGLHEARVVSATAFLGHV